MADSESNGTTPPEPGQVTAQLTINAQYVKDLSFENPRAPQSLQQQIQPEVGLNLDVKARPLGTDVYEVLLTVSATARAQGEPVFVVELTYAGVVTAKCDNQEILGALILVETPRLLFPFARQIVADATRNGGYPPLMINPIDFTELLRRQQQGAPQTATV